MSEWTNSVQFCILTYRLEANKKVLEKPILVQGREMGCGWEGPETPAAKQHAGTAQEPGKNQTPTPWKLQLSEHVTLLRLFVSTLQAAKEKGEGGPLGEQPLLKQEVLP